MIFFSKIYRLIADSVEEFIEDDCIKLSASLSYFTVFSLPALAILTIYITGHFVDEKVVESSFFDQTSNVIGNEATEQIKESIKNIQLYKNKLFTTIFSAVILLISASSVFSEIQSSINLIWKEKGEITKIQPKESVLRFLRNRLISLSMIVVIGFLLIISLVINTILKKLHNELLYFIDEDTLVFAFSVNNIAFFSVISIMFFFIFKTLPNAKIGWKEAGVGALITSTLFILGKWAIGIYISNSNQANLYGAAGSILIILIWIYYSAMILYFGAIITKQYALKFGTPVKMQ